MEKPNFLIVAIGMFPMMVAAQTATSDAVGLNKIACLPNSDTIVGVPFRAFGSLRAALTAPPQVAGASATLTFASGVFAAGELSSHYVKFIDGDRAGRWYDVQTSANSGTPNTTSTLTLSLNGDTLGAATTGNRVLIAKYWTLDTLFPPAGATTTWSETTVGSGNWVPNGHAIVASTSPLSRRTELLLPNLMGAGINISFSATFFITGGAWKRIGDTSNPNTGNTVLYPDNYFIIRNNSTVTRSTVFRSIGEVELQSMTIPLASLSGGKQDNFIGLPRPVDVRLADLGLDGVSFVNSASPLSRKDELLVFNNAVASKNKSASATYYRLNGNLWRKIGDGTVPHDNTVISAGAGFIIRKAATTSGGTAMWQNTAPY